MSEQHKPPTDEELDNLAESAEADQALFHALSWREKLISSDCQLITRLVAEVKRLREEKSAPIRRLMPKYPAEYTRRLRREFGDQVKQGLTRSGLSVEDLARECGWGPEYADDIIACRINWTVGNVAHIAHALGLNLALVEAETEEDNA